MDFKMDFKFRKFQNFKVVQMFYGEQQILEKYDNYCAALLQRKI